jgi:SAM-dependent MidA family methyltransferase
MRHARDNAGYEAGERRSTPLAHRLAARIRSHGPVSVAEYMAACLQDPEHGYYRNLTEIGRDFITAPEISQTFGELVGLWCAVAWQQMGRPSPVNLIELGPGRGTMMADMLRSLRTVPDFLSAAEVHLVESSPTLAAAQRHILAHAQVKVNWHADVETVPRGPVIAVANEFLDALPVRQYVRTADGWDERCVTIDERGALAFTDMPMDEEAIRQRLRVHAGETPPGGIVEVQDLTPIAALAAARTQAGPLVMLLIDYGHTASAPGDTLQAVRGSRYEHALTSPGEADLTVQVDFAQVARTLVAGPGLCVDGPVTQAEFLGSLGVAERASRLMAANPARANEIETAVQRLMAPAGMGTRCKAMGVRSARLPPLPGLTPTSAP